MKNRTKNIILCGLLAAVTGVCSQIIIPLPMIPINLALLAVLLSATLLGPKLGAISMCVYLLMAAVGIPVMAGFSGGLGALFWKTGGYVIGYVFCAFITGWLYKKFGNKFWKVCLVMAVGVLVDYTIGSIWFMAVTKMDILTTLMYCVFPFIIGDGLKITAAALITPKLKNRL